MGTDGKRVVLKLYITGQTEASRAALTDLKKIIDEELLGAYDLMVIDVLSNPMLAEEDKILATPTLIKVLPEPVRKIVGALSDRERVLLGLDLMVR